jgi:hypothetical protein
MPLQDLDRDDVTSLRAEIARLQSALQRLAADSLDLTVARFVVSDHEAGLPVARSTLDAAQRALGLPAIDDDED